MSSQQPRATSARPATAIDAIAESYVDSFVTLSPMEATYYGIAGHDADLDDLSPDGLAEHSALRRSTLAALAEATVPLYPPGRRWTNRSDSARCHRPAQRRS